MSIKHLLLTCTLGTMLSANEANASETSPTQTNKPYIAPATPICNNACEKYTYSLSAAYTLWVPYNNITIYDSGYGAVDNISGNDLTANTYAVSGFKVAGTMETMHDMWSLQATYTWFLHNPNMQSNTTYANVIYGLGGSGASSAMSKYYVQFNRVDGILSRKVCPSKFLTIEPWLGLLGAWDRQSLYYSIILSNPAGLNRTSLTQNWWGIGPYVGGRSTYSFTKNLGLYASTGASLLITNRSTTSLSNTSISEDPDLSSISNNKDSHNDQEVMVELSLGGIYQSDYDKFGYFLSVSWDMQTYLQHFAQFQFINGAAQSYTNFSMQGLTVAGGFSF